MSDKDIFEISSDNSFSEIPNGIKEKYEISDEIVNKSKEILTNFLNFLNDEENKDKLKEFSQIQYLDLKNIEDSVKKDLKTDIFNKIIEKKLFSNDKEDFIESSKRLIGCFYLNKKLTIFLLRSLLAGSHSSMVNTLSLLNENIREELLKEASYNLELDQNNKKYQDEELEFLYGEHSFIKNNFLVILISQFYPEGNDDYFTYDIFKSLSDNQFNSIVLEVYNTIENNPNFLVSYYILNPYFYKKLLESKTISDNIKEEIINFELEERTVKKRQAREKIGDDIEYLTMRLNDFKALEKRKQFQKEVKDQVKESLGKELESLKNTIISSPKEKLGEYKYNVIGYEIFKELDEKQRKLIFKGLLQNNFDEAIALLRNKGNHSLDFQLIKDLEIEELFKILQTGLYDREFIENNIDQFLELDQFSIVRIFSLLKNEIIIKILNTLSDDDYKKVIHSIYYLRNEKEYPIKNFRHFCKRGLDINRFKKIVNQINDPEITKFVEERILETKLVVNNTWDYNLLEKERFFINTDDIVQKIGAFYKEFKKADRQEIKDYDFDYIVQDYKNINILKEFKNILELVKYDKNIKNIYDEINSLFNSLLTILGKEEIIENKKTKLENFENNENLKGQIKLITDYKQLNYLGENDIVIINDYPTNFADFSDKNKPKAIIIGKNDSIFSHAVQLGQSLNIPVFYFPGAENYFNYFNGLEVEINNQELKIIESNKYLIPNRKSIEGNKFKGIENIVRNTSLLRSNNLSGKFFFEVLQKYHFYKINGEASGNLNLDGFIPYDEIKQLIDNIENLEKQDLSELETKIYNILDKIEIDDDLLEKYLYDIVSYNTLKYPLALRSDFLNEDSNGKRTPGLKETYLNITNKFELKKYLIEIIKQDFSKEALEYKKKNNIYLLNSTFGAILEEMIVKDNKEVNDLLSGVFEITNENGAFLFNGSLAFGLNSGITGGDIQTVNTNLEEEKLEIQQNLIMGLDEEGGIKKYGYDIRKNIDVQKLKELILSQIGELENGKKIQIEFSIKNYGDEFEQYFILLQKNYIK